MTSHPLRALGRVLALALTAGSLVLTSSPAQAADPVAGAQTAGDTQFPNVGNGGYDVSHYDLDIEWNPPTLLPPAAQSIDATATITATTTGAPLSSFSLDFEGLTVDSVTVDGAAATSTRIQVPAQTKYKLVITPATPVEGTFVTVVTYSGTPTSHTDADGSTEGWVATSDGATFVNQPIGSMTGFPNNNTPADKATYDVSLDIPSTLGLGGSAAVSNGELVSNTPNTPSAGRTTWVWDQQEQMASELVIISIGRYNMTARNLLLASGRTLPEWTFIDPTASGAAGAATAATNLKSYIDFFEARYGPYPGNSTGIVVDNLPGLGYALETQDRAFFPGSVGTSTNIHETMHQWFGNNVSPRVWNDLWLGEGPATYAEAQYTNPAGTETTFYNRWSSTGAGSSTWTTPTIDEDDDNPVDLYGSHVYDRGAMALEALRTAIGAMTFADLMEEWQVRYAGQSPGTAAFIALAEELSGRQLDAFFQDWIYDADKPAWPSRFTLSLASNPAAGPVAPGAGVTYTITAANTGKVALNGAVVTVDLTDLLDDATVDGTLPAGTTLDGSVLSWNVPSTAVAGSAVLTLPVTVDGAVTSGALGVSAQASATTLGSTCTVCTSSLAVSGDPVLASTPTPVVTGTPRVGQTLTANAGTWDAGAVLTYQWNGDGAPLAGATATTYVLTAADLGKRMSVTVTGTRPGFASASRTSAQTTQVSRGVLGAPPVPTIKGKAIVGRVLKARPGRWEAGVTLRYQWFAGRTAIKGATAKKLKVLGAYRGKRLRVVVTGSLPGYDQRVAKSRRTGPVV